MIVHIFYIHVTYLWANDFDKHNVVNRQISLNYN